MNILLTGGTGYIGSHAAVVLAQCGHNVLLFDNLSNSSVGVVERIGKILGQSLSFAQGDVRDIKQVKKLLREHRIDAVLHFAGLKAVGESVKKPIDYYENNVQGAVALLQAMQSESVRKLVFSSSATVYGEPQYLPIDENHPTAATNPYGRTKLHIEEMLCDVIRSDSTWRIASLRYFNPAGAHESGLIGESPRGTPVNLMPLIVQVAAGQRRELNIFGDDYLTSDGTGVRDYIHVMDLVEGHAAALRFLASNTGWHAMNLGTGQGHSVLEMVKAFESACGRSVPYKIMRRRPGDVARCYGDPGKAYQLLGWAAWRTLADMCYSAWNFQKNINKEGAL